MNDELYENNEDEVIYDEEDSSDSEEANEEANEETDGQETLLEEQIPKSVFLHQKAELREMKRKLRELSQKTEDEGTVKQLNQIKQMVLSRGYDEDFADTIEEVTKSIMKSLPREDSEAQSIIEEIKDMDYSSEAMKYKAEIIEKVKKYRKHGDDISVEEAFALIKPRKVKMSEMKTEIEQKQLLQRRNVEQKKGITATSSASKNPYPLDVYDKKALAQLQKAQPDRNWTAEKYYKINKK